MKYTVIRDTKEQLGWWFNSDNLLEGTVTFGLKTGDYTLKEFKDILCIERKRNTGEFASNIVSSRFEKLLDRMDQFKHPFIVLEFDMYDIYNFPINSGIPENKWADLSITSKFIIKRLLEIEMKHKAKIILAGQYGETIVYSIFKRIIDAYK